MKSFRLFLLLEKSIEKLYNEKIPTVEDDAEELFRLFYELEYKYSIIKSHSFTGLPKRKENILKILSTKLKEATRNIADSLLPVYEKWLKEHTLLNPKEWAKARLNQNEEFGNINLPSAIDEYERYARNADTGTFADIIEFMKEGKLPKLKELLIDNTILDETEHLKEIGYKKYGKERGEEFKSNKQALDFINNTYSEYYYDEYNLKDAFDNLDNREIELEFYEKLVFPVWFRYWKKEGITKTRERIQNIYNQLENLNTQTLENQVANVNIALNAAHQTGSMMEHYGWVDESFLRDMSNQDTTEWDKELKKIGIVL